MSVCGVVLAAGAGRRFGAVKQLALLHGRPLLQHAVDRACGASELDRVIAVLGAQAPEIVGAVEFGRAEVVVCDAWAEGISASLRCGVAAAGTAEWIVVTLGDEPTLPAAAITTVVEQARLAPATVGAVRAVWHGRPGHPVALRHAVAARAANVTGDVGARELLAGTEVLEVECEAFGAPTDVDLPSDLDALAASSVPARLGHTQGWHPVAMPEDDEIEVHVRLFAILRERVGVPELSLTLAAGATVGDARAALARRPGLAPIEEQSLVVAVNRDYAADSRRLADGDELALIPPVSGGATDASCSVRVAPGEIDTASLVASVADPGAGATVVFLGTTRDVGRLEYEAYAEMAQERIEAILRECVARHDLLGAAAAHRIAAVPLGEASVCVAVSAAHRGEAFAGARAAIDRIKAEAPIWKQEVVEGADGDSARWVEGTLPAVAGLTHLDADGNARMVDVGAKPATERRARARAVVRMAPATARAVLAGDGPKGDVVGTARLAGIQAAKRTPELIPLAHPLMLSWVDVDAAVDATGGTVTIEAEARTVAGTGVELEAMTAASVAALTVYDMVKGLERGVVVEQVCLLAKSGGRSGEWRRDES